MADIEIFVQGVGIPRISLMRVPDQGTVGDIITAARPLGLKLGDSVQPVVQLENREEALGLESTLASVGIGQRSRVHIHTCQRIEVTVNFKAEHEAHPFSPSTTVHVVKQWADAKFKLTGVDATEHALQLCNSTDRPSEDTQIGALVDNSSCSVCFDLVPKQRVEG